MKILMYANTFGVETQTFITQDVKYLSKQHDLFFVCTSIDTTYSNVTHNLNIKVLNYKHSLLKRILWEYDLYLTYQNQHFQKQLTGFIDKFKPDLIHCQFGLDALRLIDNLHHQNIPVVIQFRGYDASQLLKKKSYIRRLQQVLNRKNYYSLFVAKSLKKNLQQYNINIHNSMILHSGINLSMFIREENEQNDIFTFLQISSLRQKKGHEYTLEAFARFLSLQKEKTYKLILTGDGERKIKLKDLCNKLNIQNHVEFTGFVSPQEAKILLEKADAFVHHSITLDNGDEEGIPNAIMEAMAMELPIISTYHAGIPELVKDGINGYLIKERDINSYASRMADITKWKKLKINREVVSEKFEIGKHIKKLENFYHTMLSQVT